jgi:hypothetical protein
LRFELEVEVEVVAGGTFATEAEVPEGGARAGELGDTGWAQHYVSWEMERVHDA